MGRKDSRERGRRDSRDRDRRSPSRQPPRRRQRSPTPPSRKDSRDRGQKRSPARRNVPQSTRSRERSAARRANERSRSRKSGSARVAARDTGKAWNPGAVACVRPLRVRDCLTHAVELDSELSGCGLDEVRPLTHESEKPETGVDLIEQKMESHKPGIFRVLVGLSKRQKIMKDEQVMVVSDDDDAAADLPPPKAANQSAAVSSDVNRGRTADRDMQDGDMSDSMSSSGGEGGYGYGSSFKRADRERSPESVSMERSQSRRSRSHSKPFYKSKQAPSSSSKNLKSGRSIESIVRDCASSLEKCSKYGLLEDVCRPNGDSVMKMMQWRGDAVLGGLARSLVYEKSVFDKGTDQATMAKWAQLSVGNASLKELFDQASVQNIISIETCRGKQKADRMEAIIFTLDQLKQNRVGKDKWMATQAEETLNLIMEALLSIGWSRRDEDAAVGSTASRHVKTAEDIREWLKTFQCEMGEAYTHSSLFGSKDWTTNSGRLSFPDTPEVRSQLEEKLVTMYRLERPLCYVEMATPCYPFYEDIDIMCGNVGVCSS